MFNKILSILAKYTESDTIKSTSMLKADLDLSSFDLVSIVTEFEDEFHIEIPDRDIEKFVSVKDIIDYLESKI